MNREFDNLPAAVGRVYPGLYEGERQCVRHLHAGGCRNIVYVDRISVRGHFSDMTDLRFKGFVDEMTSLGCPVTGRSVVTGCKSEDEVVGRIVSLVNDGVKVDGIAARNDGMAAIAIKAMKRLGLSVPEQVSVIGFDNSNLGRSMSPAITTMEIDRIALAEGAVSILQQLMSGQTPEPVVLRTNLIVRESTR
jgi:DNA-binding LacI/PurR family transcriptional regulator